MSTHGLNFTAMIPAFLDWFATIVFALSGALAAGRKQLDLFGTATLAFVTAVGGGTIRDVVLGVTPVFWVRQSNYVLVPLLAALVAFALMRFYNFPQRAMLVCDAVGLGVFAVAGCQKALSVQPSLLIAMMMGTLTGAAGGAIRDVLVGEVPLILRSEIYATAALAGCAFLILLRKTGAPEGIALFGGAALTIVLRLLALRFKASLPRARLRQPLSTQAKEN